MAGMSDTPDGTPAGPDDINSRLAEIAAELASEARFKEPSAAERARARVTAVGPAAKQVRRRFGQLGRFGRRRAHKAEELRRPAASAGAPAPPPQPRQSRRARRAASRPVPDRGYADATTPSVLRSVITVVILVALLVGVSIGLRYLFRHFGAPAAPRPAASDTPTTTASTPPPFTASTAFMDSHAEFFANNGLGIVPPTPLRTGPFTAGQVGSAYATVKQLLIASNVTPAALHGNLTAFGRLLTHEQRIGLDTLPPAPAAPPKGAVASRAWFTVLAPRTGLVGDVIKVTGQPMTAAAGHERGRTVLQIQANYIFVYPVQQATDQHSRVRVAVRVLATVLFARWDDPHGPLEPWVSAMTTYDFNVQCGTYDGLVHPEFADLGPGTIQPGGGPVDPYDLSDPAVSCYPRAAT
jgi:hypothetical protein